MAVGEKIKQFMETSSFIRKMFETGSRLKAQFGEDKVCDFSLGNPSSRPPAELNRALNAIAGADFPGKHGYMVNAGYPDVREKVAAIASREQGVPVTADRIVMTCGASGALNTALKAILNPGDTVLVSTPYFVEYRFYADNHGGELKTVAGKKDFDLDLAELEKNITPRTRAVLINSPNNPSGRIYPEATIRELGTLLTRKNGELGHAIYLVSDEPYRHIVYDGIQVPSIFKTYPHSLIAYSYSKALSIPGERIGWLAVHPAAEDSEAVYNGCVLCNRILGYVNAPALMQKVIGLAGEATVDVAEYARKKEFLCRELKAIGYAFREPEGTFYLFPEAPGGDDLKAVDVLQKHLILTVPGSGFGSPGYFRIAFCTGDDVIERSIAGFAKAFRELAG